jgi:hypothetical protein
VCVLIFGAVASHSPHGRHQLLWKSTMKSVIESNHEAAKALALSVAGVMGAMLAWTLMMLLFY